MNIRDRFACGQVATEHATTARRNDQRVTHNPQRMQIVDLPVRDRLDHIQGHIQHEDACGLRLDRKVNATVVVSDTGQSAGIRHVIGQIDDRLLAATAEPKRVSAGFADRIANRRAENVAHALRYRLRRRGWFHRETGAKGLGASPEMCMTFGKSGPNHAVRATFSSYRAVAPRRLRQSKGPSMSQYRIGIDLGGTKIEIALLGPDGSRTAA